MTETPMGTQLYVVAMIGIKINTGDYLTPFTKKADSNEKFCPDCGEERPENDTETFDGEKAKLVLHNYWA